MPNGIKKYVRKGFRNLKKVAKKRYYNKKGRLDLMQVAKDVQMIKDVINVEKKFYNNLGASQLVGQLAINASGGYFYDATPIPAQGVTDITRNGDSIKLTSSYMSFQFWQQANTASAIRCRLYLVRNKGPTITATNAYTTFFNANPVSQVIDYNSTQNTDYTYLYEVLRKKDFKIDMDNISSQVTIKNVTIPMRYNNYHVRFASNSTTISSGQLFLFIVCDSGNTSTISTQTNCPVLTASSGLIFNFDLKHYFVDN